MVSTFSLDRPLTADDLAGLPDDGIRYELIWGELQMSPAPSTKHQRMLRKVLIRLDALLVAAGTGEVFSAPFDVHLDDINVVQPDLVVIRAEHGHRVGDSGLQGAPDVCIELLSASTRRQDLVKKYVLYAKFGISEYWIVDPERERITVHVLEAGNYVPQESDDGIARSTVIRGLEIDPRGLSSPPSPKIA